ncbi:S-methyl-5-thioribose-1-phosphate isomerase [Desulfovulcanus sp.]
MNHIYFDPEKKALVLLDQRYLPLKEEWFVCAGLNDVIYALKEMVVRGAPAIGVTAAFGCYLLAREAVNVGEWKTKIDQGLKRLSQARPTAVNLVWAVEFMRTAWAKSKIDSPGDLARLWLDLAQKILSKDISINKKMGQFGAELLEDGDVVMTHCNAGSLATGGYGTALGVIRAAIEAGKKIEVIANETRPFLQGARLTAYELKQDGIPVKVACDNAAALLMRKGLVHKVIVGADRIARNGDVANKIGTYGVALLAKAHNIPFYVAAPMSTIDPDTPTGEDIPIEERPASEVTHINGKPVVPPGVEVFNYAFDITPNELISGIITERGVFRPPYCFES